MQTTMTAQQMADALKGEGYTAKVWTGGERTRVYITRALSRGRKQEIGYVEHDAETGEWGTSLARQESTIQSICGLTR